MYIIITLLEVATAIFATAVLVFISNGFWDIVCNKKRFVLWAINLCILFAVSIFAWDRAFTSIAPYIR